MRISKAALRTLLATAVAALAAPLAIGVFTAQAKSHPTHPRHGSKLLLSAPIAPSLTTDPNLHGIMPGKKPWVLKSGHVTIRRHRLDLRVRGLLIPGVGVGPVKSIVASLYCGPDSSMTAVATTKPAPLSAKGNAVIHDRNFTVPATCLAPEILIIPTDSTMPGATMMYIGVDGLR